MQGSEIVLRNGKLKEFICKLSSLKINIILKKVKHEAFATWIVALANSLIFIEKKKILWEDLNVEL